MWRLWITPHSGTSVSVVKPWQTHGGQNQFSWWPFLTQDLWETLQSSWMQTQNSGGLKQFLEQIIFLVWKEVLTIESYNKFSQNIKLVSKYQGQFNFSWYDTLKGSS